MMKKLLSCILTLALVLCGTGVMAEGFTAGTYTGTAQGFGGEIAATVTLSDSEITEISVTGDGETAGIGSEAIKSLPGKMLEAQSPNVEAMSGATVTSAAIVEAVTAALKEAGVDAAALTPKAPETGDRTEETIEADVVIVGAGGAGMSAAITAANAGKTVVVVEKAAIAGGNTTRATGGMNAAETSVQKAAGVEDSVELFVEDTMKGGKEINDKALVTTLAENSAAAIDWLDSIGAPLPDLTMLGGSSAKRAHRPEGGAAVGSYLVPILLKNCENSDKITILYETPATQIVMKDGAAAGIKASSAAVDYTINAGAVVLASGGFAASEEMYTKYQPSLKGFVTTNAPGMTGDGIVMAEEVGAATVDMEQIQIHPTVEQSTSALITEGLRGDGAILVNAEGKRFIDELETRDVVSAAELEQTGGYAFLLFDQDLRDRVSAVNSYVNKGLTVQGDTVEELAAAMGVDAAALKETVDGWNAAIEAGKDEAFGRTSLEYPVVAAPFYAVKVAPGVHHTMGGVKIDPETQVIDVNGSVIPGLYAAGEVTGGVHGANRLGGNAVADVIVFGRIAGENAAAYASK